MPAAVSKKLILSVIKLGITIGLLLCLLFLSGIFEYPESALIDVRFRLRPAVAPSPDIVIVGITQRCLNQLGRFPWPRTYHADLINFLKKAGAKVIAMDIFFSQPDPDPLIDQQLAEAIKNAGNVILPVFMPYRISKLVSGENFIRVEYLVESIPAFTKTALSQGHINILPDDDGIYRKAPLAIKRYENVFYSLGFEAAAKFSGIPPGEITWGPDYIRLANKRIPLENSKFAYINFSDVETRSPRFAFSDVVNGLVPANNFKNKLVVVGQTTQGLPNADILQTPFKEKYGVTVQANIADTVLGDFYFKRQEKWRTCAWIMLLCIVTCVIMGCIKGRLSILLTLVMFLALCVAAIGSFISGGLILDSAPLGLAIISGFAGTILYRIRFADYLVKTKELQLDSILQAGMVTAEGLKTDKAHDVIMATIINSIGAKGLLLRWRNEKTGIYERQYVYGDAIDILKGPLAEPEERMAGDVIRARRAILIPDTRKDDLYGVHAGPAAEESHSILCAPLLLKGGVVGALTLFDKSVPGKPKLRSTFDDGDMELFLILTQQTAISLENARLFEEVSNLFLGSIRSLAQTIDAKDPYTHGHSERVTTIALAISDELGLSEEQRKQIEVGAILHDIGKLGIRDMVLSKPAQLTAEEKEIFDQHPAMGSKIMSPIEQLEGIIPLIRHHHESYDGSGYPDRLKAQQIPLGARIIAVADAFDAMTSDRPYRKALPVEAAKKEINSLGGIQFDPQVVEAFNKACAKGNIKT